MVICLLEHHDVCITCVRTNEKCVFYQVSPGTQGVLSKTDPQIFTQLSNAEVTSPSSQRIASFITLSYVALFVFLHRLFIRTVNC